MPFCLTAQENLVAATLIRLSGPRRALARHALFDLGPRASSFNGPIYAADIVPADNLNGSSQWVGIVPDT
jgi:hypothetical protein